MGALLQLPQATRRTQRKDTLRSTQRKAIINKLDVSRETAPYTHVPRFHLTTHSSNFFHQSVCLKKESNMLRITDPHFCKEFDIRKTLSSRQKTSAISARQNTKSNQPTALAVGRGSIDRPAPIDVHPFQCGSQPHRCWMGRNRQELRLQQAPRFYAWMG